MSGTYIVLENLAFAFTGPGLYLLAPMNNGALRTSEVRGNLGDGGIEVVSWGSGSVSNVVIYGNVIHDNGDVAATYDQDVHGVLVGSQVSNVWIVDNELYRNSGDGVQINGSVSSTHHIYVGRNVAHDNKQTGFWTKTAADVVFSENRTYSHLPSDSSAGAGMGFQYDPQRVWFLFNESYDNSFGLVSGSSNAGGRSGVT